MNVTLKNNEKYRGIWPVMLTPFDDNNEVDWKSLEKIIDWYLNAGVHGLFAICQSSEMFYLSERESIDITKFIIDKVDNRIPIVASGHTGNCMSQQVEQVHKMAQTGVDAVILISNRFAFAEDNDHQFLEHIQTFTEALPKNLDLGIYECPMPYKRLLTEDIVSWCAKQGQYKFIKDTSCHLPTIKTRLELCQNSSLHIANANSQTLLKSFQMGCQAYSGIMANFHPELYVWLYENWASSPEKAKHLAAYLSTSSLIENLSYPTCAKYWQYKLGNMESFNCRVRSAAHFLDSFYPDAVDDMMSLGEQIKNSL